VVRSYGRVGPFGLALEWIDGETLADALARGVSTDPIPAIRTTLSRLHDRGIALGDLHHRDVLLARDGSVYVVDLATAWLAGPDARGLRRWIFERFRDADHVALARLDARIAGRDVDLAVAAVGPRAAAWHRRGRRLKGWLDGFRRTLKLLTLLLPFGALMLAARPTPASVALGSAVVALGEALRCWAAGHLKKTVDLVTSGPYRHTRNPLYLGRLLIFTGFAVMATLPYHANALAALAGYAFFFGVYLPRKERVEPSRLRETHGERYEHYFQAVPALWPRWTAYARGGSADWSWARFVRNREHWMVVALTLVSLFMFWRA